MTSDGSHTIYVPALNESYHSRHGAVTESKHIYIEQGLAYVAAKDPASRLIRIFEMGFGTGLNAFLSLQWAIQKKICIEYHAIDTTPLDGDIVHKLNYPDVLDWQEGRKYLQLLHDVSWGEAQKIHRQFTILKTKQDIRKFLPPARSFHLIFYDAFAPSKQEEMWELSLLDNMHQALVDNGVLTTYCSRGQFKRDLCAVGFEVESLTGPPGKHEVVRATKKT